MSFFELPERDKKHQITRVQELKQAILLSTLKRLEWYEREIEDENEYQRLSSNFKDILEKLDQLGAEILSCTKKVEKVPLEPKIKTKHLMIFTDMRSEIKSILDEKYREVSKVLELSKKYTEEVSFSRPKNKRRTGSQNLPVSTNIFILCMLSIAKKDDETDYFIKDFLNFGGEFDNFITEYFPESNVLFTDLSKKDSSLTSSRDPHSWASRLRAKCWKQVKSSYEKVNAANTVPAWPDIKQMIEVELLQKICENLSIESSCKVFTLFGDELEFNDLSVPILLEYAKKFT